MAGWRQCIVADHLQPCLPTRSGGSSAVCCIIQDTLPAASIGCARATLGICEASLTRQQQQRIPGIAPLPLLMLSAALGPPAGQSAGVPYQYATL